MFHPLDIVVGMAAIYSVLARQSRPVYFKYVQNFLLVAIFSWLFSFSIFQMSSVLYGGLYLFRLIAYSYFSVYVYNFVKNNKINHKKINYKKRNKELLINSLLGVSIISAIFGWIQFFAVPDLKPFFEWGWDQHLFRLVGAFLDPTFLGLIIVFGLVISMIRFIEVKDKGKYLLIGLFLLVSLAFTYSRASYVAFLAGAGYLLYAKNKIGYVLYPIILLLALILFLPTSKNRSISFFRSFSAIARLENYADTIKVYKTSPALGIGFNNMCLARQNTVGPEPFTSHACGGSDSSLLLILATTGIVGLIVFAYSARSVLISVGQDPNFLIVGSSIVSLMVHSFFSNSMFYPWIMGWVAILLAIVGNEEAGVTKRR